MAERTWTPKQEQSITATGGSVLVSAAAGSGKTAVLVERIIRRITDPIAPVDVDRLLVVTFTRAAAAEMRQRLSIALSDKMAKEPQNSLYQRQQLLLPTAYISTVDGFCARLLQEHAGQAGLPAGFKVAEEAQAALLAAEALDTVLEQNFRRRDPAFLALADQLNSYRDDRGLREAVRQAYTFMQAQPFPQRWLREQVEAYTKVMPMEKTPWMAPILQELSFRLEGVCVALDRAVEVAHYPGLEPYLDHISAECKRLHEVKDGLLSLPYDELYHSLQSVAFTRLPPVKTSDAVAAESKDLAQAFRNEAKKRFEKVAVLLPGTEADCRADLVEMAPLAEALGRLVEEYTAAFTALKRRDKLLDYNDLEHEALRLLLDEQTGRPTPLATELSARFVEIMVDEYQDTNGAQDALFMALSRNLSNVFTVGDVKQSIYGFRQAMPEIFTARRDAYTPYDPNEKQYPALITLENNFRSRGEVTDTVNFLFRQLLQRRLGGVEYAGNEELIPSGEFPPAEGCETEWLLLDLSQGDGEQTPVQAESHLVGRRIREMVGTMQVRKTKTETRPLEWRDVCILFRNRGDIAVYAKEFDKLGIPTALETAGGLLAASEVRTVLSLLRVIDNPLREVELAAVMLSPLYGFTPDDVAMLRLAGGKRTPLYTVLEQYSHPAEEREPGLVARCRMLLSGLRRYRTLAVSLPADRLLELIYRESGAETVYAVREDGRKRVANLHALDRVARSFERGGFRGLSAFVRYVDRMEEQGHDLPTGSTQQQDGVRLMTVHKSKGLEFPVVFLARLTHQRNHEDSAKKLLFHSRIGIGLKLQDAEIKEKHITLPWMGVRCARRLDETAEELRVWYVALTRAAEKLIGVYTASNLTNVLAARAKEVQGDRLLPDTILRANCAGDVLLTAALRHMAFAPYRALPCATLPAKTDWVVTPCAPHAEGEAAQEAQQAPSPDEALTAALRQRLGYTYPYGPLLGVPAKLAASQLSHEAMGREYIAVARPAFLQKEGLTAAQKGTALHTFMQFADLAAATADLSAEVERLLSRGFLTEPQAESLPREKILGFLRSGLYARITAADEVWREYPFTVSVSAGDLTDLPADMAGETVVVQGIADCVFCEGDGLVLVDYKTDRVKTEEELVSRYRSQMVFYRRALEQLFGLPVREMLLYSFALERQVAVME